MSDDEKIEEKGDHLARRKYIAPVKSKEGKIKPVPRVLRQQEKYFCGICRKKWFSKVDAVKCLTKCIPPFLSKQQVISVEQAVRTVYRCSLCRKDMTAKDRALKCLENCKSMVLEGTFGRPESVVKEIRAKRAARKAAKAQQAEMQAAMQEESAAASAPEPAAPQPESGPGTNTAPVPDLSAELDEEPDDSAQVFYRRPNQKPFFRDGARYICSACKSKYFTKDEVEACFNKHPEGES